MGIRVVSGSNSSFSVSEGNGSSPVVRHCGLDRSDIIVSLLSVSHRLLWGSKRIGHEFPSSAFISVGLVIPIMSFLDRRFLVEREGVTVRVETHFLSGIIPVLVEVSSLVMRKSFEVVVGIGVATHGFLHKLSSLASIYSFMPHLLQACMVLVELMSFPKLRLSFAV